MNSLNKEINRVHTRKQMSVMVNECMYGVQKKDTKKTDVTKRVTGLLHGESEGLVGVVRVHDRKVTNGFR